MGEVLLGIDIGTSACKVVAFHADGSVAAQASRDYPVFYPRPGWAEQNPDDWWRAACEAIQLVLRQGGIDPADIRGIGVDGQSWSAVAVSETGEALCRTPIWMDTRARDICKRVEERVGEERLFRVSGNPLRPASTLPKILWYAEHCPETYRKTKCILQSNSYVVYRLTGVISQEPSQGYGLSCFNMELGVWDRELCGELGVNPELLPELVPCHQVVGGVTPRAAEETGLQRGIPVVAGGLDAACGALGAGVIRPGETQEQGGQAGGMSICTDRYLTERRLILGAHVVPGCWLLQGGTVGGGGVVRWFEREFGAEERLGAERGGNVFAQMDAAAAGVAPGSDGLIFLPYMAGERSPIWNPDAKGVYYGVDYLKTRAHFMRASMEGVAYSLRHNLDVAERAGVCAGVLRAMGGAANSRFWTQVKADVTGKRVLVPRADTATALGAALLAGVGTGLYSGFGEAVARTERIEREHLPDFERGEVYQRGYQRYLCLYESLKNMMIGGAV